MLLDVKAARPPHCLRLRGSERKLQAAPILRRDQPFRSRPGCHQRCHLKLHQNTSPVPLGHASHPFHHRAMPVRPLLSRHPQPRCENPPSHDLAGLSMNTISDCAGACPSSVFDRSISVFCCQSSMPCPYSAGGLSVVLTTVAPVSEICNLFAQKSSKAPDLPWWEDSEPSVYTGMCVRLLAGGLHPLIQFGVIVLAHEVHDIRSNREQ